MSEPLPPEEIPAGEPTDTGDGGTEGTEQAPPAPPPPVPTTPPVGDGVD